MLLTCQQHVVTTQDVAPILARWARVANTKLKMSGPFVSALADILISRPFLCPLTIARCYQSADAGSAAVGAGAFDAGGGGGGGEAESTTAVVGHHCATHAIGGGRAAGGSINTTIN